MRLVKNANQAWRWFSIRLAALGLAVSAAWGALPADLAAQVPGWAKDAVTGLIFAGVVAGRLIDQGGDDA